MLDFFSFLGQKYLQFCLHSIASFPIAFADIISDFTLSVAIIPVEIEINSIGLSGSTNVASIADDIF